VAGEAVRSIRGTQGAWSVGGRRFVKRKAGRPGAIKKL